MNRFARGVTTALAIVVPWWAFGIAAVRGWTWAAAASAAIGTCIVAVIGWSVMREVRS